MSEREECEIFLAINEDGQYEVAATSEDASQWLMENHGGEVSRMIRFVAFVKPPQVEEGGIIEVADDAGSTESLVVASEAAE